MFRGTAPSTTSGPMLSTAPPTARSNSPLKGKWGVVRRSARDCRDCPGHETTHSGTLLSFLTHVVIYKDFQLYLGHDGVSSFPRDAIETSQDLQHEWPGGMEAIGQSFFYDAGTHKERRPQRSRWVATERAGWDWGWLWKYWRILTETFCRHRRGSLPRLWQWSCPFPPCEGRHIQSTKSETDNINSQ